MGTKEKLKASLILFIFVQSIISLVFLSNLIFQYDKNLIGNEFYFCALSSVFTFIFAFVTVFLLHQLLMKISDFTDKIIP